MEGPSLFLAEEQLVIFRGKKVKVVSGNTKIGKERFLEKRIEDIFSWGKHLVFQFDNVALRVHFLLFGTYAATIEGKTVTGDYKKTREPRLEFDFDNGTVQMYNCSIKVFETSDLKSTYDFSKSIMSSTWNSDAAFERVKHCPEEEIADVLLDQDIFAGVGNMIKNEVLSLTFTNPKTQVKHLSDEELRKIIETVQTFSHQFYEWRKAFVLRKHLLIHRRATCPHCGEKVTREKTGKRTRWSYYCPLCQPPISSDEKVSGKT